MSLQRGQVWSKARCLSLADVTFLVRSVDGQQATWVSFDELERRGVVPTAAQVMMRPCERAVGKTLGMRASRLAATVELALASLSWSGAQERAEPWQAPTLPPLADVYR